jgi:hypothetical protein
MKQTFNPHGDAPAPMTRKERAALVDRVLLEARRDGMFAHLLANNLQAAGVVLPPSEDTGGRQTDWSHAAQVRLLADFAALRLSGLSVAAADETIAGRMPRGLSPKHVGNMRRRAQKTVAPEDLGPTLRQLIFPTGTRRA